MLMHESGAAKLARAAASTAPNGLFLAGAHAGAVADYTAILGLDVASVDEGSRVDAYYLRGVAHEKLEDLPAAIADFTATLLLEPTHVKAILARGACYNLGSEYEAACGAQQLAAPPAPLLLQLLCCSAAPFPPSPAVSSAACARIQGTHRGNESCHLALRPYNFELRDMC